MSYNITLHCGCLVYIACHPRTRLAHARVLEWRAPACQVRNHQIGLHLALWELLPERGYKPTAVLVAGDGATSRQKTGRQTVTR